MDWLIDWRSVVDVAFAWLDFWLHALVDWWQGAGDQFRNGLHRFFDQLHFDAIAIGVLFGLLIVGLRIGFRVLTFIEKA